MNFTEEQKRIFRFVQEESGHGIIDAVAGAGKTTTIMECTRYVPNSNSTLFCAFNKSIAKEINKKFREKGHLGVVVKTVHALGFQILRDNNKTAKSIELESKKYRNLLEDKNIQKKLKPYFKKIVKINGYTIESKEDWRSFAVTNVVRKATNKLIEANEKFRATLTRNDLDEFIHLVKHYGIFQKIEVDKKDFLKEMKAYFKCHQILLKEGNSYSDRTMKIDLTDMLYLPAKWEQFPAQKFDFVFIDECQDLSKAQFAIATKFGKSNSRVLAVGDPRQSIYGFAGADIKSFDFVKDTLKAKQLPLTACFRCPKLVIELAKNICKDIVGNKQTAGLVREITSDEVMALAQPNDLIISRFRKDIVLLTFEFIDKNIKVQIHEEEVKDIIKELKNIFKHQERKIDLPSQQDGFEKLKSSVLSRWDNIIEQESARILDSKERNQYKKDEKEFLGKKLEFLHKKYEQWKRDCSTIDDLLGRIKEYISATHNAIKLSTIHQAKGLENERVFILGYDGLPFQRMNHQDWETTQEINLQYVAITRSLQELYLVIN